MSNKIYEENNVSAIATSIRAKNGLSTTYKVADMSGAINGLQVLKENTQTQNPLNIKGIGCLKDYKVWGNAFQSGTPTPSNPVPIEAVGEYENGKYKIDVVSRGKNLFDGTYLKKAIGGNSGKYYYDNANYRTAIIKCEPNTLYTITRGSSTTRFIVCDNSSIANDGTELDNQLYTGSDLVRVVETHSNSKYLYICVSYSNEEPTMQVEKGSKATTYERYRKNITPIYLDKPLYKIGNVSDYIDFANGKVYRYFGETTKSAGTYTLSDSKSNSNYMCTQQASGTLSGNSLTLATGVSSAKVVYQLASLTQENITLPDIPLFNNVNTIVEVDNATGMYGKYWEIV